MKVNTVSAFRDKRGLRRVSGAEPPVMGHPPETTEIRKTVTMKTYIMRRAKAVEDFWPGTVGSLLPATSGGGWQKRGEFFGRLPGVVAALQPRANLLVHFQRTQLGSMDV